METEPGEEDPDAPHAAGGDPEHAPGASGAVAHALPGDHQAEEGLGKGHNAQQPRAHLHHVLRVGEDAHQRLRQQIEQQTAQRHEEHRHAQAGVAGIEKFAPVPLAHGDADQGGGGGAQAEARQIEDLLGVDGDGVGGKDRDAHAVHHAGEDDVAHAGDEGGAQHWQGDAPHRPQQLVIPLPKAPRGNAQLLLAEEGPGHPHAGKGGGEAGGDGRAPDAEPGGIDQQIVQPHVQHIAAQVHAHGRAGVLHGLQRRTEKAGRSEKGDGQTHQEEIGRGVGLDRGVGLHPDRQDGRDPQADRREQQAHREAEPHGQGRHTAHALPVPLPQALGQERQAAHRKGVGDGVHQPVDAGAGADGGGGRLAQMAHHGGVHVLEEGAQDLLGDGRRGQLQQGDQHGFFLVSPLHGASLLPDFLRQGEYSVSARRLQMFCSVLDKSPPLWHNGRAIDFFATGEHT